MRALTVLVICASVGVLTGCEEERIQTVRPELVVPKTEVDFGVHRVGAPTEESLLMRSQSLAAISVTGMTIEDDPDAPGGAAAFAVAQPVTGIEGEGQASAKLRFTPPAVGDFSAVLVIASDDPDPSDARKRIKLVGRGALPKIRVSAACNPPCTGFDVVEDPLSIAFGERGPLRRDGSGKFINEPVWPDVTILNDGEIPLKLVRIAFEGDAAFGTKGALDTEGVSIDQGSGQVLKVVFDPQQGGLTDRTADLLIVSDDPDHSEIRVKLTGRKAPNTAPSVCASIVKVDQPDGSEEFPLDGSGTKAFKGAVSVQPASIVTLSPFSDHFAVRNPITDGDPSLCTTDAEEGRAPLTYQWSVEERPRESRAVIARAGNPETEFIPDAIGHYKLRLQVNDGDGDTGEAFVEFEAIPKRDLVVQLTWPNQTGIDLDVHLVRPTCSNDEGCVFDPLADVNGYSWSKRRGDFDWGLNGIEDDPRLDIDDLGTTSLIENVNLNFPENDPACRTPGVDECVYDVFVHYFKDARNTSSAPTCAGTGCRAGDVCNCTQTDTQCVSGRCVTPVRPEVKVYVKPTPANPAAVLTLPMPSEEIELAGPCFMWHVARVHWPSKAIVDSDPNYASKVRVEPVGGQNSRTFRFFGALDRGVFECAPNTPPGTTPDNVTYLEVDWADRPEYQ